MAQEQSLIAYLREKHMLRCSMLAEQPTLEGFSVFAEEWLEQHRSISTVPSADNIVIRLTNNDTVPIYKPLPPQSGMANPGGAVPITKTPR